MIRTRQTGSFAIVLGIFVTLALLAVWAAYSELDKIARAPGQVIASSRTQVIQSANDGVIEALMVGEGTKVAKGDLLARLDRSQAAAAFDESQAKVAALKAALTRLQAEVFGRTLRAADFPVDVRAYPAFVANQTELYQRRQQALHAEIGALYKGLRLVRQELDITHPLLAKGDIGQTEIIRLQKQVADLEGQITNRRNKYFQDAQTDMTKVEEDLATQQQIYNERKAVLDRTEIRAPSEGIVKNIQITTPGAKVRPGDVIMELLPTDSALIVEAKLKPADIAFVVLGQPAAIKLDAYDYVIYGVLHGNVYYISADALSEKTPQGENIYYRVRIRIDEQSLAARNRERAAKPVEIQPGMTVSAEIRTGSQTVLSYLTKPVTKTLSESLRER